MNTEPSSKTRRDRRYQRCITCFLIFSLYCSSRQSAGVLGQEKIHRIPIIDVTDLYRPFEDPGDNFDLLTAYALPEVDLKAVILDTHDSFRKPVSDRPILHDSDHAGPRDAGFVSVFQLNDIFNRNVPVAAGPFQPMKFPEDKMLDAPGFQQQGVELILKVLRESSEPVAIVSFGSARPIAVAFNRDPELFHRKLARIYFSAGASSAGYLEWNIALDVNAALRLLRSDLPIDLFPCATRNGPFDIEAYSHPHNVWETAVWMAVSNRVLVQRSDMNYRIIPAGGITPSDRVFPGRLESCSLKVFSDGMFSFQITQTKTNCRIYDREDPRQNENALREALPELYRSFHPGANRCGDFWYSASFFLQLTWT